MTRPASAQARIGEDNTHPHENDTPADELTTAADPIDLATGRVVLTQIDLDLPATLPLVLARTHRSGYRLGHSFGCRSSTRWVV